MIKRYTNPRMGALWTDENEFRTMLDIEIHAAEAMVKLAGEAVQPISNRASINAERMSEIAA